MPESISRTESEKALVLGSKDLLHLAALIIKDSVYCNISGARGGYVQPLFILVLGNQ